VLSVLYICYLSLDDPLVHTQVVAYLAGLAEGGHRIHLLTFEVRRLGVMARRQRRAALAARGISWHHLRYHKRPSLPATLADVVCGAALGLWIVVRHRLRAVHARSHVAAAMAIPVACVARRALIFDIRGLMAEEYVDAGTWKPGSAPVRLTKAIERAAIRRADACVVLTRRVARLLFGDAPARPVRVIPCCADVERFATLQGARDRTRRELGIEGKLVMVYCGKFGGWYLEGDMVDFFARARATLPELHFLVISQSDGQQIREAFAARSVETTAYTVMSAPPERVGEYLTAADFAIAFIKQTFSKISSSPTKIGEYLAAGLPVLTGSGVGDVDELLTEAGVGVLVDRYETATYDRATGELAELLADQGIRERCRKTAAKQLSLRATGIPAYDSLYRLVAAGSKA
jgi:glycosyltransferase involved in cell wall biosynthesis